MYLVLQTPKNPEIINKFNVFGFDMYYYSLMIALGMVITFISVLFFWRRYKYLLDDALVIFIVCVITGIFSVRLWEIIWNKEVRDKVLENFLNFFEFAGLSIQGALLLVPIFVLISFKIFKINVNPRIAFSLIMPSFLIGQAIGRFGNMFNGELYGNQISRKSFIFKFFEFLKMEKYLLVNGNNELPVAPAWFYETLFCIVLYIILVWIINYNTFFQPGTSGALVYIYYGIWRIVKDIYIMDPKMKMELDVDSNNFAIISAIFQICIGIILILIFELNPKYNIVKTQNGWIWKKIKTS